MRHLCSLVVLSVVGCAGSEELRREMDALAQRDGAREARLEELGREIRKVENRLTASGNEAARDQKQKHEQLALALSRLGNELAELRQELGRGLDQNSQALQGVAKEQEKAQADREAARKALEAQAANEKALSALREELARLSCRLDALAEELRKPAAPPVSASPAPSQPPVVKEGAAL